jgi:hypothetical protein
MTMLPRLDQASIINRYFELELGRLRALLKRRVIWLRHQWQHSPSAEAQNGIVSDSHADWLLNSKNLDAEQQFYLENDETFALTKQAQALQREKDNLTEQRGLPIDILGHLFGLNAFERDVLLLAAAAEFDADFQALFGYVQDDLKRSYPTMHLAYVLFGSPENSVQELSASFNANAALRRYQLIHLREDYAPIALRALSLPERILDYLRGINQLDNDLQQHVIALPQAILSPSLNTNTEQLVLAINRTRADGIFPVVNLIGERDGGQRDVAIDLAHRLRIKLFELDPISIAEHEINALIALIEREALLVQAAFFIDMTAIDEPSPRLKRLINALISRTGVLIILGNRERLEQAPRIMNLQLLRLASQDRISLWQAALDETAPLVDIPRIVQQFRFGPNGVRQAVTTAKLNAAMRSNLQEHSTDLTMEDLWSACRQESELELDDLAQRIHPVHLWDDLVLQGDVLEQLHEIAQQVHHRHHVYVSWGYEQKLSRGRGISALFTGASGTGKTMAAEILANELRLPLFRIDLAGVVNKFVGETEKNLKAIFLAAEASGTILFFDEADALFGKRTDVKDSHDRYANIEVNYLLQLMENYSGLAILATNRQQSVDRAFLRRLRFLINFPFPNLDSRRRIWQRVFPQTVPLGRLDYNQLAQMEIAGGNIQTIALNAAFLAAADEGVVEMKHIAAAARREYSKLDKLDTKPILGDH